MRSQPITAACIRLEHGPFKKFLRSKIFISLKWQLPWVLFAPLFLTCCSNVHCDSRHPGE